MAETIVDLASLSDAELGKILRRCGSQRAAARELGVAESTFRDAVVRRGIAAPAPKRRSGPLPTLTRDSLHVALQPPNNCKVREFLDELDDDSREVVEEALAYDTRDFPAAALLDWLAREGFPADALPGSDAVKDHRAGRRPCRCRG